MRHSVPPGSESHKQHIDVGWMGRVRRTLALSWVGSDSHSGRTVLEKSERPGAHPRRCFALNAPPAASDFASRPPRYPAAEELVERVDDRAKAAQPHESPDP